MDEPQPQPVVRPTAAAVIGGLAVSLLIGGCLNVIAGLIAMSQHNNVLGFAIGAIPGLLFAVPAAVARKTGFAQGLLIGGCIVALLGGACAASLVGTSFH